MNISNIDLKINKTIITDNLEAIDFSKLKIGQQILAFKEKSFCYDNDEDDEVCVDYNDIVISFLSGKVFNGVYLLDTLSTNITLCEGYNENTISAEEDTKVDNNAYLKIKNKFLKIDDAYNDVYEICSLDEDEYNTYKSLYSQISSNGFEKGKFANIKNNIQISSRDISKTSTEVFEKYITKETEYTMLGYFLVDLEEDILGIKIKRLVSPSRYKLVDNIEFVVFDRDFNNFFPITLKEETISKLIKIIETEYWDHYSCELLQNLKTYKVKPSSLRNNEKLKNDLISSLNEIYYSDFNATEVVDKLINPFYCDDENKIKAYFKDFYTYYTPSIAFDYKYTSDEVLKEKYDRFAKKSKSICGFMTKDQYLIDIYTGELINIKYKYEYRDYEYIVINKDIHKVIYKRIDDIFVHVNSSSDIVKAFKTIEERKSICDKLMS